MWNSITYKAFQVSIICSAGGFHERAFVNSNHSRERVGRRFMYKNIGSYTTAIVNVFMCGSQ